MEQTARTMRLMRGAITLDWMLMVVAAIAVLLMVGTMVRISTGDDTTQRGGDLFAMRDGDTLLAFQDFTFGAPGWTPADTSDRLAGIGPALGPFTDQAVRRTFDLPPDTLDANIVFDLHMMGDWDARDMLHISVDDIDIATVHASGAAIVAPAVSRPSGVTILADRAIVVPRSTDPARSGAARPFVTTKVRIRIIDPAQTLALRLWSGARGDASWSLDNLTVVATARSAP